jgi:hypothetical protein
MSAVRYFIPVCLYPHTKYRTRAGVTALFEKYRLGASEYLIVIADRLLVLDRLVTGRYWSVNSAVVKARQEAEQMLKLIRRVASKSGAQENGRIIFWDEIAESADYIRYADRLGELVLGDALMAGAIDDFVTRRVTRFGLGSAPERERGYEREYLLSEICMSTYCTEMLGFSHEVWERPPAAGAPDPLKALYENRPALVEQATGRPVVRALSFLFPDDVKPLYYTSEELLAVT